MSNPITNTKPTPAEVSMLRFMASSARRLHKDVDVTPLGTFDTLQRINKKYKDRWLSIWIVCAHNSTRVKPETPVDLALNIMEANGGAVGIGGVCIIAGRFMLLKKPIVHGDAALASLQRSCEVVTNRLLAAMVAVS